MPYAAKATIEHQYITDHLELWLTFKQPMNQNFTPLITRWTISADGTDYEASWQAWIDEHTLKLISETIAARPVLVSVAYAGPDTNLITTWGKQWEEWGVIPSTDLSATLWQTGMIILWSGSVATIPAGWVLCNGSNGTPNLQNKFIIGAGFTYNPADIGGSTAHDHTATQASHNHMLAGGATVQGGTGFSYIMSPATPAITVNAKTELPPFYALAYIMKL